MPHPLVVHCRRARYDVLVDRTTRWGNPYVVGRDGTRDEVVALYERRLDGSPELLAALPELRGKVLGCWCSPRACHADVLARRANGPVFARPRASSRPDPVRRAAVAAARAVFTVRTPLELSRLWAAEARTVGVRGSFRGPWVDEAKRFLDWCVAERIDPARYIAAIFGAARVRAARGRPWVPYLRSIRGAYGRSIYEAWEQTERMKADGSADAELAGARRIASRQSVAAAENPAPQHPRPVRSRAPRSLDEILARDAATYLARTAAAPRLDPVGVIEQDAGAYSPAFRSVVGQELAGDADDAHAARLAASPALRARAEDLLREAGVPPDVFP